VETGSVTKAWTDNPGAERALGAFHEYYEIQGKRRWRRL